MHAGARLATVTAEQGILRRPRTARQRTTGPRRHHSKTRRQAGNDPLFNKGRLRAHEVLGRRGIM